MAKKPIVKEYPFDAAVPGETRWVSGDALIALAALIQRGVPLPDLDVFEVKETEDGVVFTLKTSATDRPFTVRKTGSDTVRVTKGYYNLATWNGVVAETGQSERTKGKWEEPDWADSPTEDWDKDYTISADATLALKVEVDALARSATVTLGWDQSGTEYLPSVQTIVDFSAEDVFAGDVVDGVIFIDIATVYWNAGSGSIDRIIQWKDGNIILPWNGDIHHEVILSDTSTSTSTSSS